MKKICSFVLTAALLSGCSSVHNTGINSTKITVPAVETKPLEASLVVGEKVKGSAQCKSFLGFAFEGPEKETYGATLQVDDGNVAPNKCTRGAIYNAIGKTNADVIVAPKYEVDTFNFLCIPFIDACLYRRATIDVQGYKGTFKEIKEMPADVVKARQGKPEFVIKNDKPLISNGIFSFLK